MYNFFAIKHIMERKEMMKVRGKFLAVMATGLLLTGCNEEDLSLEDISIEEEVIEAEEIEKPVEKTFTEEEEAYRKTMYEVLTVNSEVSNSISNLLGQLSDNPYLSQDENYLNEFRGNVTKLMLIQSLLEDMRNNNAVPEIFDNSHTLLTDGVKLYVQGGNLLVEGISELDNDKISNGSALINQNQKLIEQYTEEVSEIVN